MKRIGVILLLCISMSGCAKEEVLQEAVPTPQVAGMGVEDTAFEYQEQKPFLVLDAVGYGIDESKILYVADDVAGQTFSIINTETEEKVFEGIMYRKSSDDEVICYGDFSQYSKPGTYVAYLDKYGSSYEFNIGSDIFSNIYNGLYDRLKAKEEWSIADRCYMLSTLMLSSEIYGNNFTDWVYICREVDDICREVDDKINEDDISYTDSELCCLTGMLAHFGKVYSDIEEEKAIEKAECAVRLYSLRDLADDFSDINYYATANLYAATGNGRYLDRVNEGQWKSGEFTFLADMTYLMTEYRTDYNRCELLLDSYLNRDAEMFGRNDTIGESFVKDIEETELLSAIDELMVLGIEDYVYSGNENEIIRRNFIHYLCGCNKKAENLLASEESCLNNEKVLAKLIFIMGIVGN